jgi:diacylglycerol kinase family enzyme
VPAPIKDIVEKVAARIADAPKTARKAIVVFNPKAGGVTEADRPILIEKLELAGITDYKIVGPDGVTRQMFTRAKSCDVIIVLGGDGTARAAAELAPENAPPLILLPGGTLNMLPRALYGDLAWPEALAAALERGTVKRLTGGKANGERFFVAAIFGAPTLLGRVREAVREFRFMSALRRFQHFMKYAFARSLRARPGLERMRKAEAVGILCPSFSGDVEASDLEFVRLDAKHLLDLARVSFRALGKNWREDPAIEATRCKTGDIVSLGVIPAVLDGEPHTFLYRVRVTYDRKGPRVLALDPEPT